MQVAVEHYSPFLMEVFDQLLGVINRWMQFLMRYLPSSVQVATSKGAPVVPINNAVRIQHRDDFENELLSEQLGFIVFRVC